MKDRRRRIRNSLLAVGVICVAVAARGILFKLTDFETTNRAGDPDQDIPETWTEQPLPAEIALSELEQKIQQTIETVLPTVVAVEQAASAESPNYERFASGVLISPDGLILSQHHVSHDRRGEPGDERNVILHNGERLTAFLLGADQTLDISLLQIANAYNLPYVAVEDHVSARLGDYVLKLGHPHFYQKGRPPVVRLGRVVYAGKSYSNTDCAIDGGDSGGPFFSLNGELIGLLQSSGGPYPVRNFHRTRRPETPFQMIAPSSILPLLPRLVDGEMEERSLSRAIDTRTERRDCTILAPDDWSQGARSLARWEEQCRKARGSVVQVLVRDVPVALGTIVAGDGFVLTKASEIANRPKCRLHDGSVVDAYVVGVDPAFDLALLKLAASDLAPMNFSTTLTDKAGQLLVAPDAQGRPIACGIVSVPTRETEGPAPEKVTFAPWTGAKPPCAPEVAVQVRPPEGLLVIHVEGAARRDGLRVGDILRSADGQPMQSREDVETLAEGRRVGEIIPLKLTRNGRQLTVDLRLEPVVKSEATRGADRYQSFRRDHFPTVFEHDIPLGLDECGGPVLDLNGECVGLTIARVGHHGCLAIPAGLLPDLVVRLRQDPSLRELPERTFEAPSRRGRNRWRGERR